MRAQSLKIRLQLPGLVSSQVYWNAVSILKRHLRKTIAPAFGGDRKRLSEVHHAVTASQRSLPIPTLEQRNYFSMRSGIDKPSFAQNPATTNRYRQSRRTDSK